MSKTNLSAHNRNFLINGKLTYSEYPETAHHGLLMNARFIQGIFDDANGRDRYARFGFDRFDPDDNTDRLIAALPEWYRCGLRAFTVGMQGGGPCFTIDNSIIDNNPFGADGKSIDPNYLARLKRLLEAADSLGFVVIVSLFYGMQSIRIEDDAGIERAVVNISGWLREQRYTNVVIEIANEHNIKPFEKHPILYQPDGIVRLMKLARHVSDGIPVGCSGTGGYFNQSIVENSDIVLIHGNDQSRQSYYRLIKRCMEANPTAPIVCNEDSQAISRLEVAAKTHSSWGYYNNMTKQEPPADWSITPGEDSYFALRMAKLLGIADHDLNVCDEVMLQGFGENETTDGKRWLRVAALYPEKIDYVDFFHNGSLFYTCYDEPFTVNHMGTWRQLDVKKEQYIGHWDVHVHFTDGNTKVLSKDL